MMGSRLTTGIWLLMCFVLSFWRGDLKQGVCRAHRRAEAGAGSSSRATRLLTCDGSGRLIHWAIAATSALASEQIADEARGALT